MTSPVPPIKSSGVADDASGKHASLGEDDGYSPTTTGKSEESLPANGGILLSLSGNASYRTIIAEKARGIINKECVRSTADKIFDGYVAQTEAKVTFVRKVKGEFVPIEDDVVMKTSSHTTSLSSNAKQHLSRGPQRLRKKNPPKPTRPDNTAGAKRKSPSFRTDPKGKTTHQAVSTRFSSRKRARSIDSTCSTINVTPINYIGNYIGGLVQSMGWIIEQMKVDANFFDTVAFMNGCDKTKAVEGKDKFTGYAALVNWSYYKSDLYEKQVVGTVEGKEILESAGIANDPFSIFEKRKEKRDGHSVSYNQYGVEHRGALPPSAPLNAMPPSQRRRLQLTVAPLQDITEDQPAAPNNDAEESVARISTNVNKEDKRTFTALETMPTELYELYNMFIAKGYRAAKKSNDEEGLVFYGHLVEWVEHKGNCGDFGITPKEKMEVFKAKKDYERMKADLNEAEKNDEPVGFYKRCIANIIKECKDKLPVDAFI
eukprot:scaffold4733_cov170-Alexandrium_tamarense.AAC.15